jgi:hypothetical protein
VTLELDTWAMPGTENFERYGIDRNWGEGIVVRAPEGGPEMYLRFYEWSLFGAVREGLETQADRNQAFETTCDRAAGTATVEYPEGGVTLDLAAGDGAVEMRLSVTNRTERDWSPLAALVPCLNPGRDGGPPKTEALADLERARTCYVGEDGLEPLADREVHWLAEYGDAIEERRPDDGYPWEHKWPRGDDAVEPLLVRESPDGEWATGVAWADALGAQGHNPWNCMHLSARVGPLSPGETRTVRGAIYLLAGDADTVLERHRREF